MAIKTRLIPDQAVILAAGENSRFIPFNSRKYQKCNFVLMGEPVIASTVKALQQSGIKEILIVKSPSDDLIEKSLASIDRKKLKITFCVQDQPRGMARALLTTKDYLHDRFLVVNPQQINIYEHLRSLDQLKQLSRNSICLFSQKTDTPEKYGMLGLSGQTVTRVVEKPRDKTGLSDQRIIGIYLLNTSFLDFMKNKYASAPQTTEYELEGALDAYASQSEIFAVSTEYPALSLKYAWDLFPLARYKFSRFSPVPVIHPSAVIHPTAIVSGPVVVEAGAQVYEYALIQGPCYIGKNALVGSYCKARQGTVLEENSQIENSVEIKNSLIGFNSHIHSGFVGDSVIGTDARIGAGFITANRRLDRKTIRIPVANELIDSKTSYFGCLIGDAVKIGIHCGTNPGAIIPAGSHIMPMTMVSKTK